jgi:transposase
VEEQDLSSLTAMGVDETSRKKGHCYITAFVDLQKKGVVFVTPGKDASTLEAFKGFLETHGGHAKNVQNISMDMSPAFIKGAEEHFPEAEITFDKFHVMKLMNKALDEVRRQEQKENSVLKKTRYIWLKNVENLTEDQKETLRKLGGASSNLKVARAWRLKLALQDVFTYDSYWAPYFLDKWHWWASHSRLDPIISLAKTIKEHRQGILNYSKSKISNGILEGLNSLYKAAAAKARGYRTLRNAITAYYLVASRLELGLPLLCGATHTK